MKAPKGAFLMPKTPYMVLLEHISFNKAQKHISLNRYSSGMAAVSKLVPHLSPFYCNTYEGIFLLKMLSEMVLI